MRQNNLFDSVLLSFTSHFSYRMLGNQAPFSFFSIHFVRFAILIHSFFVFTYYYIFCSSIKQTESTKREKKMTKNIIFFFALVVIVCVCVCILMYYTFCVRNLSLHLPSGRMTMENSNRYRSIWMKKRYDEASPAAIYIVKF